MKNKPPQNPDNTPEGGLHKATCWAWIPASNPPDGFTRVIAKNEHEEIADAYYIARPSPGFYTAVVGGVLPWKHVTHYIPWPQ